MRQFRRIVASGRGAQPCHLVHRANLTPLFGQRGLGSLTKCWSVRRLLSSRPPNLRPRWWRTSWPARVPSATRSTSTFSRKGLAVQHGSELATVARDDLGGRRHQSTACADVQNFGVHRSRDGKQRDPAPARRRWCFRRSTNSGLHANLQRVVRACMAEIFLHRLVSVLICTRARASSITCAGATNSRPMR